MEVWIVAIAVAGGATVCLLGHWIAFNLLRRRDSEGVVQNRERAGRYTSE